MTTAKSSKQPSVKLSPETVALAQKLTPAQRDQAVKIASKLLAINAHKSKPNG